MFPKLFEDDSWLAIDKPAGINVHNDSQKSVLSQMPGDLWPVHRLDQETSGVLMLAKSKKAAEHLAQLFEKREVNKSYRAILRGTLPVGTELVRNWPLSEQAQGYRDPAGPAQKSAETRVQVLRSNAYFSEVELDLRTGRTHQIRRHAALARHHVVGDTRYTKPGYQERIAEIYKVNRLFLHAEKIEIPSLGLTILSPLPQEYSLLFPVVST